MIVLLVSGRDLWVADAPTEMAERVVLLLGRAGWQQMAAAGRQFVVQDFAWECSAIGSTVLRKRCANDLRRIRQLI